MKKKTAKKQSRDQRSLRQQMLRSPEEIDAAQEAKEERRIAERREGAADVRNQKNEKHKNMDVAIAVIVGPDEWAGSLPSRRPWYSVPTVSNTVLEIGEPYRLPRTTIPPATVNNASNRRMNGMYSSRAVCTSAYVTGTTPTDSESGSATNAAHTAAILP